MSTIRVEVEVPELTSAQLKWLKLFLNEDELNWTAESSIPGAELAALIDDGIVQWTYQHRHELTRLGRAVLAHYEREAG